MRIGHLAALTFDDGKAFFEMPERRLGTVAPLLGVWKATVAGAGASGSVGGEGTLSSGGGPPELPPEAKFWTIVMYCDHGKCGPGS